MSPPFWRIGTDTKDYTAEELSGKGAEKAGGRWNPPGSPMVYASATRALACLETIVHLNAGDLPLNRYLVEITVPESLLAAAERRSVADLRIGWDAEPPGKDSVDFGEAWLKSARTALLLVPSVVVPEEQNLLINPRHSDAGAVIAAKVRRWTYDPRLLKRAAA